jgi:hypothetical protein
MYIMAAEPISTAYFIWQKRFSGKKSLVMILKGFGTKTSR